MSLLSELRAYWDEDAATYDHSPSHQPDTVLERAAWLRAVEELLPEAPARVLDVGAGTGFLALHAAALGHRVTAADLAPSMLAALARKAAAAGLEITTVETDADNPPEGPFDVVVERHVLWTLPDPSASLARWRAVAPGGRLVLFESLWGGGAGPLDAARARAVRELRRLRRTPPDHHAPYPEDLRAALPLGGGPGIEDLVAAVGRAGWDAPRLVRLRDVEWARNRRVGYPERLLAATPWFAIVAAGPASAERTG